MKFISCLFLFICLNVNAQDCAKYRTGVFEVDNGDGTISVIKRTEKFQTEKDGEVNLKDRIEWIDECSYRLIPVRIKDKSGKIGDDILTFTFVGSTDYSYTVQITGLCDEIFETEVFVKGYLETMGN